MNVLILSHLFDPREFEGYLKADFPELTFRSATDENDAGDFLEEADILIGLHFPDSVLRRAHHLKWIQAMIAGTDHIENLPSFQRRRDIVLTSAAGIHGPQMSELAIMLMIALNRKFPQVVRNQDRRVWESWPAPLLQGKKVGILGVGTIGRAIAQKCKAFEMIVLGVGPHPREVEEVDRFHHLDDLHAVMAEVDYMVSVAPSKPDNQNIFNAQAFSKMKPTAFFINLGRGEQVDEDDLVAALQNRRIAGAALDTFRREPLPPEHPFWRLDNLILTPHVGGRSDIYVQQAVAIIRENLKRFVGSEKENLLNIVPRN
jgi:phosphoglycerate dehydrogenase-like enzyme